MKSRMENLIAWVGFILMCGMVDAICILHLMGFDSLAEVFRMI